MIRISHGERWEQNDERRELARSVMATVDMLLELNDNSAKLVEDALTILEGGGTGGDTGAPCE